MRMPTFGVHLCKLKPHVGGIPKIRGLGQGKPPQGIQAQGN
jgi:hypothetical protein